MWGCLLPGFLRGVLCYIESRILRKLAEEIFFSKRLRLNNTQQSVIIPLCNKLKIGKHCSKLLARHPVFCTLENEKER